MTDTNQQVQLELDKSETVEQQVSRFDAMIKNVDQTDFNGENFIRKYTLKDNDFSIISGMFGLGGHQMDELLDPNDVDKTNRFIQALSEWMTYWAKKNKRIWIQIVHEEFRDEDTVNTYLLLRRLSATVYKTK